MGQHNQWASLKRFAPTFIVIVCRPSLIHIVNQVQGNALLGRALFLGAVESFSPMKWTSHGMKTIEHQDHDTQDCWSLYAHDSGKDAVAWGDSSTEGSDEGKLILLQLRN